MSLIIRPTSHHDHIGILAYLRQGPKNAVIHPGVAGKGRRNQVGVEPANELRVARLDGANKNRRLDMCKDQNIQIAEPAPARLQNDVVPLGDFVEIEEPCEKRVDVGILKDQTPRSLTPGDFRTMADPLNKFSGASKNLHV